MVGQIVERQLAVREEEVLNRAALVPTVLPSVHDHLLRLANSCGELDIVAFKSGEIVLEFRDKVFTLVEEDCSAGVIEGPPEGGLVGEAEDEEVTWRRAASEDGGDEREFARGHFGGGVGGGGVVEEGGGEWWREAGGKGGGGWGVGVVVGEEGGEEEGEGEEREEGEEP